MTTLREWLDRLEEFDPDDWGEIGKLCFNWWQKWKIVHAWKQEREVLIRKVERVNAYFEKVDAGEFPDGPLPPEIRQDLRDILADWRQDLLRQEGLL